MDKTKDWELYEAGKKYNNNLKPNYYDTVDANIAFFNGDQWRNIETEDMPKPVFNIIKRVITFMVASLTSNNVKIQFEPLPLSDDNPNLNDEGLQASEIANSAVANLFEKLKMSNRIKDALFDAAISGDACIHFTFNKDAQPFGSAYADILGEIEAELVDGTNVYFGNANNRNTHIQPYIIISGRDTVENLKAEAKEHKDSEEENIQSDRNYQDMAGDAGEIEVESDDYGKALYIIVYRKDKKTGTIKASKSVENAYIYKDVDTGLKYYPVAWMNWEKQKNQYHGRAICTGMLPNQIFINRMFAMVMYHLMMSAFPKAVFNNDVIEEWTNGIAEAVKVKGLGPEYNISNVAGYLQPGNMSNQIVQVIELAMQYTKETLGISDAAMGNIDPKNTSAIIAVQKSSAIPLENPRANEYEWVEDIGQILVDMMGTYYGLRPVIIEDNGQKSIASFDFSQLKNLWLNIKADVGEASYWSEIATVQTLDNLLQGGYIDIVDYLERLPDEYVPRKQELISKFEQQMQQAQNMQQDYEAMAQFMETLPPDVQEKLKAMPPDQMEQAVKQLMQGTA